MQEPPRAVLRQGKLHDPPPSASLTDVEPVGSQGQVGTYAGVYYREGPGKGAKSYGGYADYHRGPGHFVMKIPDGLDPALAAPMLVSPAAPRPCRGSVTECLSRDWWDSAVA